MGKTAMNLQDSFLNQVRKEGTEVRVVMLDGAELTGTVRGFDNFTVILQCADTQHMLYKHAIAQVVSTKPLRRESPQDRRGGGHGGQGGRGPSRSEPKNEPFNTIDVSKVRDANQS